MKARYWSLAIILILINYLIFATLFSSLMEMDFTPANATRTPIPTFTPAPAQPFIIVPTLTPPTIVPTPTATRVIPPKEAGSDNDSLPAKNNEAANKPQLIAPGTVNIRSGPGLTYAVIGALNANTNRPIIGRNADASWWQIEITADKQGWVSNAVVKASHTDNVPIITVDPPPAAAIPAQPAAGNTPPRTGKTFTG